METLDLRSIRLFVEDWGGPIGLGFAGRRPELIHSLMISNTWAWPAQDTPQLVRFSFLAGSFIDRFLITRLNILTRILVPYRLIARKMSPAEVQGYYKPHSARESRIPQAIFPREILASHVYLREVEVGFDKLAKKPVLLLWGERDVAFGAAERLSFLDHFPHAEIVLLPNAKHIVHVDEPDCTVDAILAFDKK